MKFLENGSRPQPPTSRFNGYQHILCFNASLTQTYRQTLRNVRVVAKGVGTDVLIYIDMCITHIYWQTLRNMRVVWKKCWSRSKLFLISSLPIRECPFFCCSHCLSSPFHTHTFLPSSSLFLSLPLIPLLPFPVALFQLSSCLNSICPS